MPSHQTEEIDSLPEIMKMSNDHIMTKRKSNRSEYLFIYTTFVYDTPLI